MLALMARLNVWRLPAANALAAWTTNFHADEQLSPPSTTSWVPVIYLDSSEARKSAA